MQETPGTENGPEKRRSFLVDAKWQSSIASHLIVSAMVVVALTQIIMIYFLSSGESPEEMSSGEWRLAAMLTSALQLVLLVGAMWRTAIRITHAVAGPAAVIERAIVAMGEGRFDSRLQLRQSDALQSLAAAVQRLSDRLRQQQGAPAAPAAREPHAVEAAPTLMTSSAETPQRSAASLAAPHEGTRHGERGFTLVDASMAAVLLIIGTFAATMMGVYCSNLQLRIRDYSAAHMVACDVLERLRGTPLNEVYSTYSANPVLTVHGRRVTVSFPQAILNQTFAGTMDPASAKVAGFLPVRLTVQSGQVNFVLSTLVSKS
ncbi:MAG TPA: hypothetical protein VFD82_04215 [Planctomycetota bacterium]|nr:hypothetical protein [Planctomycetota bacterium]